MTCLPLDRRAFVRAAGSGLLVPAALSACIAQSSGEALPPRAIGRPMPAGVELPASPQGAPAEGSVGIAVMGLGGYALRQIMPAMLETDRVHVAALVSGNPDKAARVADAYGVPRDAVYGYDSFDAIASDDRVEAVYVILPSGLHADWTERAFAAGKHVLCEKPMALTSQACLRMIEAGIRADRKLMIGYRCHFEPANLRAVELTAGGAVGEIKRIETTHEYRMGPTNPAENWRVNRALAGGGALEDYGIYGVQAAVYLSGEMPDGLTAALDWPQDDPRFAEIPAGIASLWSLPSGAAAEISTSYNASGGNSVAVEGTKGTLRMRPAKGYSGNTIVIEGDGGRRTEDTAPSSVQFAAMLDHFAGAVREGMPLKVGGEMGLRDVRLIEAIYAAAEADGALGLDPDGQIVR